MDALRKQVGGEHYKKLAIQPAEFIADKYYNFFVGNVVKYLTRDKGKRLEDLEKAYHYIELEIPSFPLGKITTSHIVWNLRQEPFFKQFKNGDTYARVVGYTCCGNKAKAKELLRKFINKGQYSEV